MTNLDPQEAHLRLLPRQWPIVLLAALCMLTALAITAYATHRASAPVERADLAGLANGIDDVRLVDSGGHPVTWSALNGKPRIVFFGFTRCPEICPITVAELSSALEQLEPVAGDVEVDFISVDPQHDTPERLAAYFQSFGARFHGFTGERAEIDKITHAFGASYEYVPTPDGDYTVNHTAIIYLVNARGRVVDIIGYGNPHDRTVAQLRAFLS